MQIKFESILRSGLQQSLKQGCKCMWFIVGYIQKKPVKASIDQLLTVPWGQGCTFEVSWSAEGSSLEEGL